MAGAKVPLTFRIFKGDQLLREERLSLSVIKLGKVPSAHLKLDDETVSRMHAIIEVNGPGDVSIIGFDDVPEAAYFTPPLTTIRPDFAAVATASLELLMAQVESGPGNAGLRRTIEPTLIERESVADPAR